MTNPETRRALRNIAVIAVTFVLLYFVWQWTDKLDSDGLREAMRWAMAIIGLFALSVGFENGLRALKLKAGKDGIEIDAGGDE